MADEYKLVFADLKKEKTFKWGELFNLYKEKTKKISPTSFYNFLREQTAREKIVKIDKNNYLVLVEK